MYMRFFGLKQEPFSLAPDPRYLYMSKRHREALAHLLYGVGGGGGFVLLSGEIGAGKTTVCRCFLEQIPKRCNVAYIFNPKLTVIELVKSVCDEFRIPYELPPAEPATVKTYVDALNAFLLKTHAVGQNNVLIIDEAQLLSVDVLEQLRLLTNLETNEKKLLQIVLIGQPELRTMLERPELEQLAQRVVARFHLHALSSKETEHYIRHRLSVAGMTRAIPFDGKALQRIFQITRGVPRRINLLCDRAMLGAYAHGKHQIDVEMIEKSAREVFGRSEPDAPDRSRLGRSAGLGLVVAAALALVALLALAAYEGYQRLTAPATLASATTPRAAASASSATSASPASSASAASASAAAAASASWSSASASSRSSQSAAASASPGVAAASAALPKAATPPAWMAAASHAAASAASAASSAAPHVGEAVAASAPPLDTLAELKAQLPVLGRDEKSAWRELAALWKLNLDAGDPCTVASHQQVRCFKFATALATVRSLDRPGFMSLRDDAGKTVQVVLVGLNGDSATLLAEGRPRAVSLAALRRLWHGEFGTLWHVPAGYTTALEEGAEGPLVDRLATQLAELAGEQAPEGKQKFDAALRTKLVRFQSTHGLSPAGKAGPTTFMQLNRASHVDEPTLLAGAGPR
jgi:general secretion pathway protein A